MRESALFAMAQRTPGLASSTHTTGPGESPCRKLENSGGHGLRASAVQNRERPAAFVWRLGGGGPRRSSSGGSSSSRSAPDMAVGAPLVPVFRACFDPWSHDQHDDGCEGCSKISKARAAAAAVAAAAAAAVRPPTPHAPPTRSECHLCSLFVFSGSIPMFHRSVSPQEPPRPRCVPSRAGGTVP